MRRLNTKQKDLLKKWHDEVEPSRNHRLLGGALSPLWRWDDLSLEQIETLEKIHDFETIHWDVSRFLGDLNMKGVGE